MNQYSVLFDNAGAQLPPMDGSIILKDGRYCLFDNDRNCLVTLPCTFGVGEVGTMLQCEPVDELRREYGWKYRIEEKGLWGWIHPQFQQVIPPIFNTFHFTTEDSSCLMMATVPGSGAHYVRGLWVLCGHWSKAVLAPLKMPANSVRTLEDGSPDAHFIILDYPMWTMNCRIRFWNREENGQQLSCVSVYADQCNEGALVTGNTFYWEVGTDGPTDFTDIRITGTSSNTHFVFYPDGRRSAFSCPGHPDEQFLPYIRNYTGPYVEKTLISAPTSDGNQTVSLHAVCRMDERPLLALERESTNGKSFDERKLLTPYAFTGLDVAYKVNHEDRETPEIYLIADQYGKKGIIKISQYSWMDRAEYFLPCEYDSIHITDERIRVTRMGQKGELNLHGRWLELLHD